MRLRERDYQLLRLCYEQQFLTREHLASFFGQFTAKYRWARRIEGLGLIEREKGLLADTAFIVKLTKTGETVVQQKYGISFPPLKPLNLNTVCHDALVTSVRLRLAEIWPDGIFVPERAIKAQEFPAIPDGIVVFPNKTAVSIEIECSDKGKRRFLERAEMLRQSQSFRFTLYVVPEMHLFKILENYLASYSDKSSIVVVNWKDLQLGRPEMRLSCLAAP